MSDDYTNKKLRQLISSDRIHEIDNWIKKYPPEGKQSALLRALMLVQEEHGYLTQTLMDAVADYLDLAPITVYEAATFYSMYENKPVGKHIINVCTNISCQLAGCTTIVNYLQQKLGIKFNETTADGKYTLRAAECLAACVNAPMMQIDKDYHENLTPEKIDQILIQYQ